VTSTLGNVRALVFVMLSAALVACGSSAAAPSAETTALTVSYWPNGPNAEGLKKWTLRCAPARGTLPRPAVACRKLAGAGARLFAPVPDGVACTMIYGGPQVARVIGMVNGKRVWAAFNLQNGCEIARWNRLSPWLLPRGGITS
jgi:hypothetical protein